MTVIQYIHLKIPEPIWQISHNAQFCNKMCTYVHISVTKWCTLGYEHGALWDLGNSTIRVPPRHMTSSNGNIYRVTGHLCGEFTGDRWIPAHRPVTQSFDVFFGLHLTKPLSKQLWGWWFETPPFLLWRHRTYWSAKSWSLTAILQLSHLFSLTVLCSLTVCLDCLNIKTVLSTYGDFHVKDKTAVRTSYL